MSQTIPRADTRQFLLLSALTPGDARPGLDTLGTAAIRYRGDLQIQGRQARDYSTIPNDRSLLCVCDEYGDVYRSEGGGQVTVLADVISHFASRAVFQHIQTGETYNLTLTTRDRSLLRFCMTRVGYSDDEITTCLKTGVITTDVHRLARLYIEALRAVADRAFEITKDLHRNLDSVTVTDIISSVAIPSETSAN